MGLNQPKIPRSFFEKWVYLDLSYHSLKKMILGDVHCFIGFYIGYWLLVAGC